MSRVVVRVYELECDSADQAVIEQLRALLPAPAAVVAPVDKRLPAPAVTSPANPAPPERGLAQRPKPGAPTALQADVLALITRRPGILGTEIAETIFGDASRGKLIAVGRITTRLMLDKKIERIGWGSARRHYLAGAAPDDPAPPPAKPRAESLTRDHIEAPLRVHVRQGDPIPKSDPTGRVAGVATPTVTPGSLSERIVEAVRASSGTTVQALAQQLLGSATAAEVRRVDMLVGPLVMAGAVARSNGRLFGSSKEAAAAPAPLLPRREAGRPAPLGDVQRRKDAFDRIVEAFSEDNAYPIPQLAEELFGDRSGRSCNKVQLMLRQVVATERLQRVGPNEYRAVGDREELGRVLDDEDAGDDDTETNGHADDDETEELDLG